MQGCQLLVEALATIWQLMRRIPGAAVRREYRRLWQAFKRRPEPAVLQVYALKSALHFHSFMMAKQMMADADEKERNEYHAVPQPAAGEPIAVSA